MSAIGDSSGPARADPRGASPRRPARYRGSRGAGQRWEELAAKHLEAAGYVIRERNFRGRTGEIDLIAEESGVLCFIEVKGGAAPGSVYPPRP